MPNAGVPTQEAYGRVFSVGGQVLFVGKTGAWQLTDSGTSWIQRYRLTSGTVIVTSSLGISETVLFMDSKLNIWRLGQDGIVSLVQPTSFSLDSYQICEASNGIMVVGNNRVLGTVRSELIVSTGQKEIPTFSPPLRDVSINSLVYNSHCGSFVLTISGQDVSTPLLVKYQRYKFVDSAWILIDDSLAKHSSVVEQQGKTFILSNNELFVTSSCPPVIDGESVLRTKKVNAIARLSDSTLALYQLYNNPNEGSPIYIFDSNGLRLIDSVLVAPDEMLLDVLPHGDRLLVQYQGRTLFYQSGSLISTIPWPTSKTPAIYYKAVGDGTTATMYGSGQLTPHVLTLSSGEWKPMFVVGLDTTQIVVVDGACRFGSVTYLWNAENLYVSSGQDAMGQYFKLISAPRRINHVRPISESQALVLLEIKQRDTVAPCWYSYSTSTETLTGHPDNWPRAIDILPVVETTFDQSTGTITAGTLTYWLGGRTDTSQYPVYGVLQRGTQDAQWKMVNDGLSLSLRCYSLKLNKHGVLFMLAGYSDGTLSYPRPSLYVSTDVGLNWTRSTTPLPNDLGKNVRLSVTENGVFVHENSCYRVLNNGEEFNRIEFSTGDVGEVFTMIDGLDSTRMTMATSTGVYSVMTLVSSVDDADEVVDFAMIIGNCVTVHSQSIRGYSDISIVTLLGSTVYTQSINVEQCNKFSFYLPFELSVGVYFLVVGNRVFALSKL